MSYDSEVAADSPAIYWKLQETSGTSATDSSGNARTGTYNGTVTTNYALNQSVSLLPAYPSLKSVKFMRDSGTDGGWPTTRANLSDGSTLNGKASVSLAYASWNGMNVAGSAFSAETWFQVPSTLHRQASTSTMVLASRRSSAPLQWQMYLSGQAAAFSAARWEASVSATMGQIAYTSIVGYTPEAAIEALTGGDYETKIEDLAGASKYAVDLYDSSPHHGVVAFGAASVKAYLDGVLGYSYYNSGVPAIASNTADALVFGGINTSGNMTGFMGYMSHCAFYSSELSAARIAAHYTAGFGNVVTLNQQWALYAAQEMALTEGVSLGSTLAYIANYPFVLNDTLNATEDAMLVARAGMALAAAVNATTMQTLNQKLNVALLDSTSIAAAVAGSKFAQFLLAETVGLNAAAGIGSVSAMSLADLITAAVSLRAGDEEYVGWVINPNLAASTAAEGLNFLSMARHKAQYYGLKADGIYRLGGDTDAGANINAFVSLAQSDFGTPKQKRIPYAYIGAASDGRMLLRVLVNGQSYTYGTKNPSRDMAEQRVDIGKGLRGNYWQFELLNQNGEDFELDKVKFLPVVLERRI